MRRLNEVNEQLEAMHFLLLNIIANNLVAQCMVGMHDVNDLQN